MAAGQAIETNPSQGPGPDSRMLVLPGPAAFSSFRLASLISNINKAVNSNAVTAIRTAYVHYVALRSPESLDANNSDKRKLVDALLKYDQPLDLSDPLNALLVNVISNDSVSETDAHLVRIIPRPGTISPWSSKATNIFQVCGLDSVVERVERGLAILICVRKGFPLDMYLKDEVVLNHLHDKMTQLVLQRAPTYGDLFVHHPPRPLVTVDLTKSPKDRLEEANQKFGLALSPGEIQYLVDAFLASNRNPTDVELFMFAQVNSEHCRHKIFNADWKIDGEQKPLSLFKMIRNTQDKAGEYTVSAYSDNAAVLSGPPASFFAPLFDTGVWSLTDETVHFLAKVETHNHPTAVSPYPGAATGSGGEIRDEGAVGRGSKPKAGLSGFSVSDLCIPEGKQPWELDVGRPPHIASSLDIMIEAPIGSASFNNEFGRPAIGGYFRTLTTSVINYAGKREYRGFHKPIMLAGGVGNVRPQFALKNKAIVPGSHLIVLGGPSMLIGLGGGAASSVASGAGSAELDFASVQRGNPEMERRAQMVIDGCTALGDGNPILSIHDVGAGGLSNALPELVHDNGLGAKFELRNIPNAEPGMSPMEIWCNEAQERYVLAVSSEDLPIFEKIAERERCPYAVVGTATSEQRLVLTDRLQGTVPIDLDMSTLFSKPPKMSRIATTKPLKLPEFDTSLASYYNTNTNILADAIDRVLHLPAVGSKSFLITIGDRTVTGLVARDQMVGPWQTPVADVSVTTTSYLEGNTTGEAFSVGEKPNLAIISPRASAQMAVAESLLNLVAANIAKLPHVKLSANWMAAPSHEGEGANLYEAVEAIGLELCPVLGIGIPVGKDSMSMKMKWTNPKAKEPVEVTAPVSLVVTAFSPVENVHNTWTPTLVRTYEDSRDDSQIILVDLAGGKKRLGGSALAQVYGQVGNSAPQVENALLLKGFVDACRELHQEDLVLAYHDRSEGGLFTTLVEMAFAGRVGLDITLQREDDVIPTLFNEELGAVFQVENHKVEKFYSVLASHGIQDIRSVALVRGSKDQQVTISQDGKILYSNTRATLQQAWTYTSYKMQRLRDNPKTTDQEYAAISDNSDPGLQYRLSFDIMAPSPLDSSTFNKLPKVAILREQGVNGHAEMAYAFMSAGFRPVDVHMTDILSNRVDLSDFTGLAACGGFSYGDVLGAGAGWAKSVLYHPKVREKFATFFVRKDTFALGVCNGCQFFSRLRELIPGAEHWPSFERNASEQYEARVCMLEVVDEAKQPCVFFEGMRGSKLPVAVAHGEGRAVFASKESRHLLQNGQANGGCGSLVGVRYVDNYGTATERYPFNPNGSIDAIAGVRSPDGRVLAMMPHPERVILKQANSYISDDMKSPEWGSYGPWIRMFQNARRWVS